MEAVYQAAQDATSSELEAATPIEAQFVECWGRLAAALGFPSALGRTHAQIYVAARAVTLDELCARLGIARSEASHHVLELLTLGAIRPAGDEAYEAVDDPWKWFISAIAVRRRRELEPVVQSVRALRDAAREAVSEARGSDRERLRRSYRRIELFAGFASELSHLMEAAAAMGVGPLLRMVRVVGRSIPRFARGN